MAETYRAVALTEKVYWVGAIDWTLRDFHGYTTNRGSSYNAYLILADRVTLLDTVKKPFKDELMARIASVSIHVGLRSSSLTILRWTIQAAWTR